MAAPPLPLLIFCGGGNPRYGQIAIDAGFAYGCRIPDDKPYFPLVFADQNWSKPCREKYMAALAHHKPNMATVLDWEREEQLSEVLDWAHEAASHVRQWVIIIPKVAGRAFQIPECVAGKPVVLGYSVATGFGKTTCDLSEFDGRRVHLLGGSPHEQMRLWALLSGPISGTLPGLEVRAEVVSVDGNMAMKMANQFNKFWAASASLSVGNHWPTLREAEAAEGREPWGHDAPYEAFRRSCANIFAAWGMMAEGRMA